MSKAGDNRSQIYIDLGAHRGHTVAAAIEAAPDIRVYAFEPNPALAAILRDRFGARVDVIEAACWIADGTSKFYLGNEYSSTLIEGKKHNPRYPQFDISYQDFAMVRTIDFAKWLLDNFAGREDLIVKMDIEGAEYEVLPRLIATGAIRLIGELRCEWHWDRFPVTKAEDERIKALVSASTKLVKWG